MAAEPVGASLLMTPWEIKQILNHAVCEMAIAPPSLSISLRLSLFLLPSNVLSFYFPILALFFTPNVKVCYVRAITDS